MQSRFRTTQKKHPWRSTRRKICSNKWAALSSENWCCLEISCFCWPRYLTAIQRHSGVRQNGCLFTLKSDRTMSNFFNLRYHKSLHIQGVQGDVFGFRHDCYLAKLLYCVDAPTTTWYRSSLLLMLNMLSNSRRLGKHRINMKSFTEIERNQSNKLKQTDLVFLKEKTSQLHVLKAGCHSIVMLLDTARHPVAFPFLDFSEWNSALAKVLQKIFFAWSLEIRSCGSCKCSTAQCNSEKL